MIVRLVDGTTVSPTKDGVDSTVGIWTPSINGVSIARVRCMIKFSSSSTGGTGNIVAKMIPGWYTTSTEYETSSMTVTAETPTWTWNAGTTPIAAGNIISFSSGANYLGGCCLKVTINCPATLTAAPNISYCLLDVQLVRNSS